MPRRKNPPYMTVQQLINLLQQCDPSWAVIASIDPEGNGYGSVDGVDNTGLYDPQKKTILIDALTEDLRKVGYTEKDVFNPAKGHVHAIILWPSE